VEYELLFAHNFALNLNQQRGILLWVTQHGSDVVCSTVDERNEQLMFLRGYLPVFYELGLECEEDTDLLWPEQFVHLLVAENG
jgi:hypothetical protein